VRLVILGPEQFVISAPPRKSGRGLPQSGTLRAEQWSFEFWSRIGAMGVQTFGPEEFCPPTCFRLPRKINFCNQHNCFILRGGCFRLEKLNIIINYGC
jgi:hypothetical protein